MLDLDRPQAESDPLLTAGTIETPTLQRDILMTVNTGVSISGYFSDLIQFRSIPRRVIVSSNSTFAF